MKLHKILAKDVSEFMSWACVEDRIYLHVLLTMFEPPGMEKQDLSPPETVFQKPKNSYQPGKIWPIPPAINPTPHPLENYGCFAKLCKVWIAWHIVNYINCVKSWLELHTLPGKRAYWQLFEPLVIVITIKDAGNFTPSETLNGPSCLIYFI